MPRGPEHYEEHIQSRKVQPPPVLYKYTTAETARTILKSGTLRYQSPRNYNDPFDSQWDIFWRVPERERSLLDHALRDPTTWPKETDPRWRAELERQVARIAAFPESDRDRLLDEMLAEGISSQVVQVREDQLRRMRVFCLCAEDRSLLMWSHYAEQHCGVLLGFDTGTLEQAFHRPVEQVQYRAELPDLVDADAYARSSIFGLPTPLLPKVSLDGWALFKSADWEYEKEWRFAWNAPKGTLGDYGYYPLPGAALAEVVVGCRTKPEDAVEIKRCAVAIQPKVRLGHMSLCRGRFELIKNLEDNRGVP